MPDDPEDTAKTQPMRQRKRDRDALVNKHPTPVSGVLVSHELHDAPPGESFDSMTPPPQSVPDPIEIAAGRIQSRTESIVNRPGPTPDAGALSTAITAHVVRGELYQFKTEITTKVDGLSTKVDGISRTVVEGMSAELDRRREEDHLAKKADLELRTVREIKDVEVSKTRQVTEIQTEGTRAKSWIEIRSKAIMLVLAVVASGVGIHDCVK